MEKKEIHPIILKFADAKFDDHHSETNSQIGKFIVIFEQVQEWNRTILKQLLKDNGLSNLILGEILLHDTTAGALAHYLKAAFYELYHDELHKKENQKVKSDIDLLYAKLLKAAALRNDVAHANWKYIMKMNLETKEFDTIWLEPKKFRVQKNGLTGIFKTQINLKELKIMNAEIFLLSTFLQKLWFNIKDKCQLNASFNSDLLKSLTLEIPESDAPSLRNKLYKDDVVI